VEIKKGKIENAKDGAGYAEKKCEWEETAKMKPPHHPTREQSLWPDKKKQNAE
jgi:hypothetical protein